MKESETITQIRSQYPAAWDILSRYEFRKIAPNAPLTHSLAMESLVARKQLYIVLASERMHAEIHHHFGRLFFLVDPNSLLILSSSLAGTSVLSRIIRQPTKKKPTESTDILVLNEVKELFPAAFQTLNELADRAWASTPRFCSMSMARLPELILGDIMRILAIPSYRVSLELMLDVPVTFRFKEPYEIAAGSRISAQGELQAWTGTRILSQQDETQL